MNARLAWWLQSLLIVALLLAWAWMALVVVEAQRLLKVGDPRARGFAGAVTVAARTPIW